MWHLQRLDIRPTQLLGLCELAVGIIGLFVSVRTLSEPLTPADHAARFALAFMFLVRGGVDLLPDTYTRLKRCLRFTVFIRAVVALAALSYLLVP